ncbi:hypothetical protein BSKO_04249 [Bryopsis sp. KO-2023]|nr:hypothetical protein BSKO_04249 [Bryopsis sp. KO-2023]
MGVPGLFGWIKRSCRETIKPFGVEERVSQDGCDNLYVDLNHIVHGCTHAAFHCKSTDEDDVREAFEHVKAYVVRLVRLAAPRKLLFLAVDGVAPRAKMNQQRGRRFLSAYTRQQSARIEKEIRKDMNGEAKRKLDIDPLPDFDSNVITPGTPFMELLSILLQELVQQQLNSNPAWKELLVVLSPASEPGEGEHKIMRFIRNQRCLPGYDPNLRHSIFGQDADLILLSLLTHEPHFEIIREDMHNSGEGLMPLMKLDIGILRRYLKQGLGELDGSKEEDEKGGQDEWGVGPEETEGKKVEADEKKVEIDAKTFERMLDDFVFLTFMVGNDFLPSIPSLDIYDRGGGLDLLMHAYKCMRQKNDAFITDRGMVNFAKLKKLLQEVAKDEEESYKRKEMQRQYKHRKMMEEAAAERAAEEGAKGKDSRFGEGGWISVGELQPGKNIDEALGTDFGRSCEKYQGDLLADLDKKELQGELKGRLQMKINELLLEGNKADPLRLGITGYRERYYQNLFGATAGDGIERTSRKICGEYLKGLAWVFAYYVRGNNPVATSPGSLVLQEAEQPTEKKKRGKGKQTGQESDGPLYASWDWFYPYFYAPLMQDLVKFSGDSSKVRGKALRAGPLDLAEYDKGKMEPRNGPVLPLIQLMSVVPPQSAPACLPTKLVSILQSASNEPGGSEYGSFSNFLGEMFPEDVGKLIDARGKLWAHTVIVKLPFSNPEKLAKAAIMPVPDEAELTIEEEDRNIFTPAQLFFHEDSKMSEMLDEGEDSKKKAAESKENTINQEELLMPLLIDDGDEEDEEDEEDIEDCGEGIGSTDDSATVLVAAIDIAGASTEAFVSELLPGVDILDTPLGQSMFRVPWIARSHDERGGRHGAGRHGEGQRGRGRWEGRGRGDSSIRGRLKEPVRQPLEGGGRGTSTNGRGHFARSGAEAGGGRWVGRGAGHRGSARGGTRGGTRGSFKTHRRHGDVVQETTPMTEAKNRGFDDWGQNSSDTGGGQNWEDQFETGQGSTASTTNDNGWGLTPSRMGDSHEKSDGWPGVEPSSGAPGNSTLGSGCDDSQPASTMALSSSLQEDSVWAVSTERTEWGLEEAPQPSRAENDWRSRRHQPKHQLGPDPLLEAVESMGGDFGSPTFSGRPGQRPNSVSTPPPGFQQSHQHGMRTHGSGGYRPKGGEGNRGGRGPPGFSTPHFSSNYRQDRKKRTEDSGKWRDAESGGTKDVRHGDNEVSEKKELPLVGALGFMESVRKAHR